MPQTTERLRVLSLLAAIGELSASTGLPNDGVELLDQTSSLRWYLEAAARPYASFSSLQHNGYVGDERQVNGDLHRLIEWEYVAFTPTQEIALTPAGLAVYQGRTEFAEGRGSAAG
jgi:hypothetical protein